MDNILKPYIDRLCFKCKKQLNFQDFYATNKVLGKKRAFELWHNPLLEYYCCRCFRIEEKKKYEEIHKRMQKIAQERQEEKQRELLERMNGKKVLILGIQNSGKTAIINVLQDRCLSRIFNLLPTRGWSIHDICVYNVRYIAWDLGGVSRYRLKWINSKELIFTETTEIVYLIDIQDTSSCMDSIKYLSDIIQILKIEDIKNNLDTNFRFNILFHKVDPEVIESPKIIENINFLTQCIEDLEFPFRYEIERTSLFNFQKNYSERLFNQPIEFGSLVSNLFSSTTA